MEKKPKPNQQIRTKPTQPVDFDILFTIPGRTDLTTSPGMQVPFSSCSANEGASIWSCTQQSVQYKGKTTQSEDLLFMVPELAGNKML